MIAIILGFLPTLAQAESYKILSEARLKKGEIQVFELAGKAGDYVILDINSKQGRYQLDILDNENKPRRRLATAQKNAISSRFIYDATDKLQLTVLDDGEFSAKAQFLTPEPNTVLPTDNEAYLSPIIANLAKNIDNHQAIDDFWWQQREKGTPLVEASEGDKAILTFLYYGAKNNVRLFGAPSGDHEELLRLGKSNLWYKSFEVPKTTRLSYQLAADVPNIHANAREQRMAIVATAMADPYNKSSFPLNAIDDYAKESIIELQSAQAQPYIGEQGAPKGKISDYYFKSELLKNKRNISIYRSPNIDKNSQPILLYVFDGKEYQSKVRLPQILDNMVAKQAIGPIIAVFIENPDRETRAAELPANPIFADFMVKELSPFIAEKIGFNVQASNTVLAGSSYGGLAALSIALRYPQSFGNVISMSGSFWWHPKGVLDEDNEYIASQIARNPKPNLRVFLSAGLFEGGHSGGTASIIDANRHLRHVLNAKNIENYYHEYAGGHDYIIWQGAISDGLIALFKK